MATRQREEVLNVTLATVLHAFGINADPETILHSGAERPDVIIDYRGMRIVIEGKLADTAKAEQLTADQAQERIDLGIGHIALAVLYPKYLRETEFKGLAKEMAVASYRFCVMSEIGKSPWHTGGVADILTELRRAHESMSSQDVVQQAAEQLSNNLDGVAMLFTAQPKVCEDLASVLGVGKPGNETKLVREKRHRTTAKVAALTVANAFIFQEQLAGSGVGGVESLRDTLRYGDFVSRTIKHWDWIAKEINYVPIFQIATDILSKVPAGTAADGALRQLAEQALKVCANKAALRHDLMGRIYHYLLHEAKFLGTYYTSVSAATLLLKLALNHDRWPELDFGNEKTLTAFRAADLTCGTGTLLMATCQAVTDNFVIASAKQKKKLTAKRFGRVHNALIEHIIHGYDVLPSAIHLTASTLALLSPEVVFDKMHLYSMPLSMKGKTALLGSLEFMEHAESLAQMNLFNAPDADSETHTIGSKGLKGAKAELPMTDLFVMNPPFVRSVGGNLLFGNLPEDQRDRMQTALKARVQKQQLSANITAGLGGVFVALADKYVRPGGCLAFVLPAALTMGAAWDETRKLIAERYHLEFVVVSHEVDRWSFSENTSLSELLFVARRLKPDEQTEEQDTVFVNLWRNPANVGDALAIARLINTTKAARIDKDVKGFAVASLTEHGRKYGELVAVGTSDLDFGWWGSAFAQTELARLAYNLRRGQFVVAGTKPISIPVVPLGERGVLGPDARDIHDGFEDLGHPTAYPAFWNHEAGRDKTMEQTPNRWLSPRSEPAPGRERVRNLDLLVPRAGRLLLAERLRVNSQRLSAVYLADPVFSNTWWSTKLVDDDPRKGKALALWQNSTLGLLGLLFARVPSEGAWVKFKKPQLDALPVLDIDSLSIPKLDALAAAFDKLGVLELQPLSACGTDPVRAEIDKAIATVLGLPDLTSIRQMLGREPTITNAPILPPDVVASETAPQMNLVLV